MEGLRVEVREQIDVLKTIREENGYSRKAFAEKYGIPVRTVEDWEAGKRKMPEYLLRLIVYRNNIERILDIGNEENPNETKNVNIITDVDGKKIVLINDIMFKSRRTISWTKVEECLKEYIGTNYEILETSDTIYIGQDFPDEFCHSDDKIHLKGGNLKAKANIVTAVDKLIQISTNKAKYPDYESKHKSKAKYGWYRYDTRFGIPVYDENGELTRYNIFSTRMLVRCDKDGKLYLYDFVRTKKETSSPLE